jgi:flagellar assembly factor FliW
MSEKNKMSRVINTTQFGELEIDSEHIFHFDDGVLGFEDLREFVLIAEEETLPFKWLISLENPVIGFPLLSPWHIDLTYNPTNDYNIETEAVMVVITLEDEKGLMTANMKAPIILNVNDLKGKQIILPSDKYLPSFVIKKN